jgi:23S rRNA pseudouridine1911/1915/1917 synthase
MKPNLLEVVYEDNHIIVVFKPANILSQADDSNDLDMMMIIKDYLKDKYQKPGNVFLGLVHRLDRRVSGLMVYAKTSKAASRLSDVIRKRDIDKEYLAIVTGKTPLKGSLTDYLVKTKVNKDYKALIVDKNTNGSKEAVLEYEVLKYVRINGEDASILRIILNTGRYNQIRAQLTNFGHPIINDYKYNYRGENILDELALVSYKLSFPHPTKDEIMEFESLPKSELWKDLKED